MELPSHLEAWLKAVLGNIHITGSDRLAGWLLASLSGGPSKMLLVCQLNSNQPPFKSQIVSQ
jgi:hypothetical protein